jgi:hypothetical protein
MTHTYMYINAQADACVRDTVHFTTAIKCLISLALAKEPCIEIETHKMSERVI